jgi:hypothetical protein
MHAVLTSATALLAALAICLSQDPKKPEKPPVRFEIPSALKAEHDALHEELVVATKAGGKTGDAARSVAGVLHEHFVKEEEYALPPLGALAALARGTATADVRSVLTMTDKLKAELDTMLREHGAIVGALEKLVAAATEEGKPEVAAFAKRLIHHAQIEEQVMYPAAVLVGEYVRLRFEPKR